MFSKGNINLVLLIAIDYPLWNVVIQSFLSFLPFSQKIKILKSIFLILLGLVFLVVFLLKSIFLMMFGSVEVFYILCRARLKETGNNVRLIKNNLTLGKEGITLKAKEFCAISMYVFCIDCDHLGKY